MKVETQKRDIQRSSSFEEKTMGLAVGSEAFVFNVLRKDLYSDPIGSLIREYTVNAQDEHRKYGKADTPILIEVPNRFVPELHIRDFAGGLTEEQVFEFFGNYGASDKRDSNLAVGFFGLGCKSAFAYTDSYIVKSFKDGMEYTFNIYIDETEIGKTAKISAEPTTEPNGIEIIVPVKEYDINTFQEKVIDTVQHFKVKPTLKGFAETPTFESKKAIIEGEGWEFFGNGTPSVIMGEIAYPVDRYKMGNVEGWEANLLSSDIHIHVNIGDVQVTASREALQMSEKTIAVIHQKLVTIKDSMVKETQKAFDEAKNLVEAKTLWYKVIQNGGGYSQIVKGEGILWNGEVIKDEYIKFDQTLHSLVTYTAKRRNTDIIEARYGNTLRCDGEVIYFDDTDKANVGYKRRARTLLNTSQKQVTILMTQDQAELEKSLGMSVKEFASFNSVVPTKATSHRIGTGTDLSKRAKHTSKVFVLNVDKLKNGDYSASSEVWDVKEVDSMKGVYLPINRFKPHGVPNIYDLEWLAIIIRAMESAGMSVNIPIYGIKTGTDVTGLGRFDKWVRGKVDANKALHKDYSVALATSDHELTDVHYLNPEKLPDGSVAKTYVMAWKALKKFGTASDNKYRILKYFPVEVKADKTVNKLAKEFKLKYPMLKFVGSYDYSKSEVLDYIKERESKGEAAQAASA